MMSKNSLQSWYQNNQINYSEKERLNKIGVNDYDYYNLQDLKQILLCEEWAENNSEIRNKLSSKVIKKIIFFTPAFNDSKPDASNYSCAIIIDGNNDNWVIIYRPSYVSGVENDLIIENISNSSYSSVESSLNSEYPITALKGLPCDNKYLHWKHLSLDSKYNPDKYILPLDIIYRPINRNFNHYAIYLGNNWIAHLLNDGEGFKFDSWSNFYPSNGSSSSFSSSSSSSSSANSGNYSVCIYHPKIPFKKKEVIIRHVGKAISYSYGRYSYNARTNNCEHITRRCVLGIDSSTQAENNHSYTRSKFQIKQEKFQERIEVCPKDLCRVS